MTAGALWLRAAALWVGCLVPATPWLAVLGLPLLGAARRPGRLRALVAVAGLVLVGSGLAGARHALLDAGLLPRLAARGGSAVLQASVATEPRQARHGWWLLVRVRAVDGRPTRERALLRVDDDEEPPPLGARLVFPATARPLERHGFGAHLRRLHAAVAVDAVGPLAVRAAAPWPLAVTTAARERTRAAAARHLDPDRAALLAGLVTGDTRGQSPARVQAFLDAGLTHLVAVSGSNVALVVAGVTGVAGVCGIGARGRRRAALASVGVFTVLTRWEPSVLRAGLMASLVLAAAQRGRGHDPRHVLAVATLLLLLVDPLLAGQLGFALSVLATAGVLVLAPALAPRLPGPRPLRMLLAATLGAQAAVAPVLVMVGSGLPLAALPANLVAVPAAAVASAIGVTAALLAQVSVPLGGAVALLAHPALSVVLAAADGFAGGPRLTAAALLTPAALALAAAAMLRRRIPRVAAGVAIATCVVLVLPPPARAPAVRTLTLTAFDVGQGDALLVEVPTTPTPRRLLVDGGPEPDLALRLLTARGVRALDAVAVSHPHADHTNGLPAVLADLPVGTLLVGPNPPASEVAASARETLAVARRRGVPVVTLRAGQRFALGSATVEVLSPPDVAGPVDDLNEHSLVLRVDGPGGRILLTGDAEAGAQARLLARPERLRVDVVKVPHHGGDTNARGFLQATAARHAVISVGGDNGYGHPHPAVLAQLTGMQVHRTDRDGTVTLALDAPAAAAPAAAAPDGTGPDVPFQATAKAAAAHRRGRAARAGAGRPPPAGHAGVGPRPARSQGEASRRDPAVPRAAPRRCRPRARGRVGRADRPARHARRRRRGWALQRA